MRYSIQKVALYKVNVNPYQFDGKELIDPWTEAENLALYKETIMAENWKNIQK